MNIYVDTEFNGFNGDLISMALVAVDGNEFYEVLPCEDPSPWVARNVIPSLNKEPIDKYIFKHTLQRFLICYESLHIIADWPEDIKHLCEALITGPGEMMAIPPITFEMKRGLTVESKLHHNALEDARALMEADVGSNYEL